MSKRLQLVQKKLVVLRKVHELKSTLFASLKESKVTKADKEEGWKEVLRVAQSVGLINYTKNWTFVRDSLYSVWKSRTLTKRENVKGGSKQKFDAVDEMIMKIIEMDPLSIDKVEDVDDVEPVAEYDVPETSMPTEAPSRKRKVQESDDDEFDIEEKILNLELMRVKIYKARLKCLALERNLGVPLSEITKPLLEDPNNTDDTKLFY